MSRSPGQPPVYLPPSLYDAALARGIDMTGFEKQEQILIIDHPMPSSAEMRAELARKVSAGERLGAFHNARVSRKTHGGRVCGGDMVCQPGLGGKCTACADEQ